MSDAEAAVKRVGAHRPLDVVVELMNAAQGAVPAVRWRLSKECTDVTTDASREACAEYQALKIEEATAREGERLTSELRDARARLDETAMPVGSADPQAETLQKVLGFIGIDVTRKTARTLLNVGVVLLIDVAASTMFTLTFVATGGSDDGAKGGATRRGGEKSLRDEELTPDNSTSQKITVTRQRIPRAGEAVGVVSLWAAARLSAVPGASVTCGDTFKDFEAWAEANGQPRIDPVKFGVAAAAIVSGLGGEKVKRRDARYFDGIAIIEGTVQ
ncbi:hypothetical protein [Hyphomicrobium sp. DY-1]|uniref:hypothetical protein n=1 Tax=Hyphomicrobium sp. DY-1 TaxID=3075650 RepID=UPI0039C2403A